MRAVAYIRVSSADQVDGYSLDAQERSYHELCNSRGWEALRVYREEGKSAHSDSIQKRPAFRQLLEDAGSGQFNMVVVHTMDRWARNVRVALDSMSTLGRYGVELKSVTEDLDRSTPLGRFSTTLVAGMAELFSDTLGTHVKKGVSERARMGFHLGAIPFGFESCWMEEMGERRRRCTPEHPGAVHVHHEEGPAVTELFKRYASGTTTLSQLATWLNDQGFRTRNMHKLPDANGDMAAQPRLFTVASVRGILHNPFHMGKVRHKDQLLPGVHKPLVSQELFDTVQAAMKRNSGRSSTLHPRPEREYLLKGLIKCAHCGLPMWAQTYYNGNRYYREQKGSRGHGYCVGRSRSMRCDVPDEQMGKIVSAIVLPDSWMDRVLVKIHLGDEVIRVQQEKVRVEQRLKRLGEVYLDGLRTRDDYLREKRALEEQSASLAVPGIDATAEAGKLLDNLPTLWEEANITERRRILMAMLDAVYVDTVEEKAVVAFRPKPAFIPLFLVATTREGSGVVLITDTPPDLDGPEASDSCSWWRRGGVKRYLKRGLAVLIVVSWGATRPWPPRGSPDLLSYGFTSVKGPSSVASRLAWPSSKPRRWSLISSASRSLYARYARSL